LSGKELPAQALASVNVKRKARNGWDKKIEGATAVRLVAPSKLSRKVYDLCPLPTGDATRR